MSLILAALLATPIEGTTTVPLTPKSVRTWSIALPADPFKKVSGELPIRHPGGAGFKAESKGVGLAIDTDGDGETDRVVEGREHPETKVRQARVTLKSGDFRYPVRLEDRGDGWMWASSGTRSGALGGVAVELIDLDGNARFDDVGRDAIVVGGTDVAQFLGTTLSIDGDLWSVDVSENGDALTAAPYTGTTGKLDVHAAFEGKGVLLAAVVKSVDGKHSFEMSAHEEGLEVPVASYYVSSATLGLGDARVVCDAETMDAIRVHEGGDAKLAWGGPVKASFKFERADGQLVLDPRDVAYVGRAGERWTGWDPIGKSPTFHVKDAVTGDVLIDAVFPGSC